MGGSQQQLDAMIAETMVPILATPSARLPFVPSAAVGLIEVFVAHGDVFSEAQQSWALVVTGSGSLDMANLLVVVTRFLDNTDVSRFRQRVIKLIKRDHCNSIIHE